MGTYSKRQFARSDFDGTGYQLNEIEGVFAGMLTCKKYGKNKNVVAFAELDDGRKIICTAYQKPGNYLGIPDIEVGTRIILEFKRTKQGKIRLHSVRAE